MTDRTIIIIALAAVGLVGVVVLGEELLGFLSLRQRLADKARQESLAALERERAAQREAAEASTGDIIGGVLDPLGLFH